MRIHKYAREGKRQELEEHLLSNPSDINAKDKVSTYIIIDHHNYHHPICRLDVLHYIMQPMGGVRILLPSWYPRVQMLMMAVHYMLQSQGGI